MLLDDQIRRLSETILEEVRSPIEAALQRLLADVMKLADADREEAVRTALAAAAAVHETSMAALREEAQAGRVDLDGVRAQFELERHASLSELREQLDRERDIAVQAAREEAAASYQSHLEEQEARLSAEHETAMQAARQEAAASYQAHLEEQEARLSADHEAAVQAVREQLGRSHESELSAARAAAELAGGAALAAAVAHAEQEKQQLEAEKRQAEDALEQARAEAREAADAAEQALGSAHEAGREEEMACTDRILTAFRQLDGAHSLTEILNALADCAAIETGRAAILIAAGSRLRGWAVRGLPEADPAAIDVPIEPGTIFDLAVTRGAPVSTLEASVGQADSPLSALLAVPAGRAGLAVPISVGGRTVAILYADDGGDRPPVVPSTWPELAEILARHAGRCLEALTVSRGSQPAAGARHAPEMAAVRPHETTAFAEQQREEESARRYARLLISELMLYNQAAVEQGRAERDLLERLAPDIERVRRLYEEKIPESVSRRVDILDQEMLRTLAGGDPDLLGRTWG